MYGGATIIIGQGFVLPDNRGRNSCDETTIELTRFAQRNDGVAVVGALPRPAIGAGDELYIHGLIVCVVAVEKTAKPLGCVKWRKPVKLYVGWILGIGFKNDNGPHPPSVGDVGGKCGAGPKGYLAVNAFEVVALGGQIGVVFPSLLIDKITSVSHWVFDVCVDIDH